MPEPVVDEKEAKLKKLIKESLQEVAEERRVEKEKNPKSKHWVDDLFD